MNQAQVNWVGMALEETCGTILGAHMTLWISRRPGPQQLEIAEALSALLAMTGKDKRGRRIGILVLLRSAGYLASIKTATDELQASVEAEDSLERLQPKKQRAKRW